MDWTWSETPPEAPPRGPRARPPHREGLARYCRRVTVVHRPQAGPTGLERPAGSDGGVNRWRETPGPRGPYPPLHPRLSETPRPTTDSGEGTLPRSDRGGWVDPKAGFFPSFLRRPSGTGRGPGSRLPCPSSGPGSCVLPGQLRGLLVLGPFGPSGASVARGWCVGGGRLDSGECGRESGVPGGLPPPLYPIPVPRLPSPRRWWRSRTVATGGAETNPRQGTAVMILVDVTSTPVGVGPHRVPTQ